MTKLAKVRFLKLDLEKIATVDGRVVICVSPSGKLNNISRHVDKLTNGAVTRLINDREFKTSKGGRVYTITWPTGLKAEALDVLVVETRMKSAVVRQVGAALGKLKGKMPLNFFLRSSQFAQDLIMGICLRNYCFARYKKEKNETLGDVIIHSLQPEKAKLATKPLLAVADGVVTTRDFVNEPANHLTTTEFAKRLELMSNFGLDVTVLDEAALASLGMNMLLSVGRGSDTPSKVIILKWNGASSDVDPLILVGKGVVFDSGGISLKPAAGMHDMKMDMAGAAVVAGVMSTLAQRKAKANVIGIVGLVENMPSGCAMRPGDVVTSLKGDTVEIINTDAEGRLVLGDLLSYAQNTFSPQAIIDLATLTGAVIISLGHEHAGVFSNNDKLCGAFLNAAAVEGEGAWRLPLSPSYDKLLKSKVADFKNIGGREAGAITAAQFLQRFVSQDCPWIHLDIAGVSFRNMDTDFAPHGATGWGVMSLNRLIMDNFEGT
ncbi:MAG: leucyl aminopeptidase [Aestuariivita sp.]|nr:leucyl aminopeptidase [Aestuariivita sp.]